MTAVAVNGSIESYAQAETSEYMEAPQPVFCCPTQQKVDYKSLGLIMISGVALGVYFSKMYYAR